jgi:16S rRNA G966 N2-methylase RsmD
MPLKDSENYRFRRRNPIEREKLTINRLVARTLKPERVLDAFAGDGTSTRIFARYAAQVLAIEKDGGNIDRLLTLRNTRKLTVARSNNLSVLPLLEAHSFDLVDFDPYGSCYPQLEYAARLVSHEGAILITSGEVQRVVRGLELAHLPISRCYRGRRAVLWAERVWIPFLLGSLTNGTKLHLIHFFTSPVLTRVILGTDGAKRKLRVLGGRKNYLGWFETAIASVDAR